VTVYDLPPINAALNAASTVFIALGWWFIRHDRKKQHIACIVSALVTSAAFLACYLTYHFAGVLTVKFTHPGIVKSIYYFILITHIILAIAVVPLVIMTVIPALRAIFDKHRRMGRITMPVWLYVSVTGVLVYFMLYQWFPAEEVLKRRAQQTLQP
jgi:uncharacterized membrane protein YozB (DUF420 family)